MILKNEKSAELLPFQIEELKDPHSNIYLHCKHTMTAERENPFSGRHDTVCIICRQKVIK